MSVRRVFPPAPTARRVVLLTAHPDRASFNHALASAWSDGMAAQGVAVTQIHVHDLQFEPCLRVAYRADQPLEPDLIAVRDVLASAAHVAVASPVWWGSVPAGLKGLFDRVLLPGWAFAYDEAHWPVQGLRGRSGRVMLTMDAPVWYDSLMYLGSARRQLATATLGFCGIKPVRTRSFGSLATSTAAQREGMLRTAHQDGVRDGQLVVRAMGQALLPAAVAPARG